LVTGTNSIVSLPDGIELVQASNGDLSLIVDTSDDNEIGEYVI